MTALIIFVATYTVVAIGHLPGTRLDRTGAALLGAVCMVVFGVLSLEDAYKAIDMDTIALLLGMMLVVANLKLSGAFRVVSNFAVTHVRRPIYLLAIIVLITGLFSAFFVNDTICLVLTPIVFHVTERLKRNPVPYLLAVAMASNAGSTATITGNPQNILIGSISHIPYTRFAAALSPAAVVALILTVVVLRLFYRNEFSHDGNLHLEHEHRVHVVKPLLIVAVVVSLAAVVCFFAGLPIAEVALAAGSVLLITRSVKPHKVFREVDFELLILFTGLFIVVAGLEKTDLLKDLLRAAQSWHLEHPAILSGLTAVLSNLVSNVPAVLILKPFVVRLRDAQHAWLVLAMSSTLAGNFTIVGSVANLIVVQRARAHHVHIGFWEYFRVGAPLTVLSILAGVALLS